MQNTTQHMPPHCCIPNPLNCFQISFALSLAVFKLYAGRTVHVSNAPHSINCNTENFVKSNIWNNKCNLVGKRAVVKLHLLMRLKMCTVWHDMPYDYDYGQYGGWIKNRAQFMQQLNNIYFGYLENFVNNHLCIFILILVSVLEKTKAVSE